MSDIKETELILRFLSRNYPTYRLKHNMRFKRTIVLEDGQYFLSDKEASKALYFKLLDILKIVFSFEKPTTESALKTFLHLRNEPSYKS